jgi:hypothetical protein
MNRFLVLWPLALLTASVVHAHPYHDSLTEIDYRAECRCLEIALRLEPLDIESMLQQTIGARLPIEHARMQTALKDYIARKFELRVGSEPVKLDWVGVQSDVRGTWVFLQSPAVQPPLKLRNQLLIDREPTQINRVLIRNGRSRASLRFSQLDPATQTLALPQPQ